MRYFNFEDTPNVLIAGAPGGGKSNHVNQMIATMVTMNTPQKVRLLLIDNKGGIEFTHWNGIKHSLRPMIKSASDVLPTLQYVRELINSRLALFETIKAKKLSAYNAKVDESSRLPRIIVVIDELATLIGLGQLTTDIQNELRVISSQGRAVGVHLILCTQHSSVDIIPGWVKTNMGMRISSKMPSHQASMVILDSIAAATLPSIAGRMVFSLGRDEVIAQSPYISDEEIARAVKVSQEYPDPVDLETVHQKPRETFTREDLIGHALAINGRLNAERINERVGNKVAPIRKLRTMIKRLIAETEDTGIEYEGEMYIPRKVDRGYVLQKMEHQTEHESDEDTTEIEALDREAEAEVLS